jgi:BASS family bile acid:Na+ symporter
MDINRLINLVATITLIEMMFTIGIGITFADILTVARDRRLVLRALVANYLLVPAVTLALIFLFNVQPMVAVGILIVAVCPGAPYGPPFNSIANGNVLVAVGLMVILAGTSAILAPILLGLLLPTIAAGEQVKIDPLHMVGTLIFSQFLPLCLGLLLATRKPALARRLKNPAAKISLLLNLTTLALILAVQFGILLQIRLRGYLGMLALVLASALAGWILGGAGSQARKTLAISTATRNVGVGLVIATAAFPAPPAIPAATAYAIFQTLLVALIALAWGHLAPKPKLPQPHDTLGLRPG